MLIKPLSQQTGVLPWNIEKRGSTDLGVRLHKAFLTPSRGSMAERIQIVEVFGSKHKILKKTGVEFLLVFLFTKVYNENKKWRMNC